MVTLAATNCGDVNDAICGSGVPDGARTVTVVLAGWVPGVLTDSTTPALSASPGFTGAPEMPVGTTTRSRRVGSAGSETTLAAAVPSNRTVFCDGVTLKLLPTIASVSPTRKLVVATPSAVSVRVMM